MTTTDYATLTDRELDAIVAERVIGMTQAAVADFALGRLPYFLKWEGAGLVLEAMIARGWTYSIDHDGELVDMEYVKVTDGDAFGLDVIAGSAFNDSVPRAVCIAALRALDAEAAS